MQRILDIAREKAASTALIIGVFVFWELFCLAANISDILLPRPTQIIAALIKYWPAIWPHTYQTLYTTLVGFAFGVAIGVAIGVLIGSSCPSSNHLRPLGALSNGVSDPSLVEVRLRFGDASSGGAGWSCA